MSLTSNEALRMVAAAQQKAGEAGAAISTAVVDAGGHLLALVRMERSPWLTADSAHAMAYTAAGFGMAGAKLTRFAAAPWFQALTVQSGGLVTAADGALPIRRDGSVIGAIACSGASDEVDLACAEAGIAALGVSV
ncbi:MAG TPA: heme-binding protein [Dehalococcoidia bacterium]|nr:heme-binding protein [Dehalococcoidia bacterium]